QKSKKLDVKRKRSPSSSGKVIEVPGQPSAPAKKAKTDGDQSPGSSKLKTPQSSATTADVRILHPSCSRLIAGGFSFFDRKNTSTRPRRRTKYEFFPFLLPALISYGSVQDGLKLLQSPRALLT